MRQTLTRLAVETDGKSLIDITRKVAAAVTESGIEEGLATLHCRHTSASLLIQENAAPEVRTDLEAFFSRLVAEDPKLYRHNDEGPDDMPAHIRTALTQTNLSIPIDQGRLLLGTWQGIYLFEHRGHRHRREIILHLLGE